MFGCARCFTRPPDNLGTPLQLPGPGRNPFAPSDTSIVPHPRRLVKRFRRRSGPHTADSGRRSKVASHCSRPFSDGMGSFRSGRGRGAPGSFVTRRRPVEPVDAAVPRTVIRDPVSADLPQLCWRHCVHVRSVHSRSSCGQFGVRRRSAAGRLRTPPGHPSAIPWPLRSPLSGQPAE